MNEYPSIEIIPAQLSTIRSVAQNAINMIEETEDPQSIQTCLDMIQVAVDYLRGTPIEIIPEPIPIECEFEIPDDVKLDMVKNDFPYIEANLTGFDFQPIIKNPNLFGDVSGVFDITLDIPVICGKFYTIKQINPALSNYPDDPSIKKLDEDIWIKEKEYYAKRDSLEYSFLIPEGRNQIKILIKSEDDEVVLNMTINTHIHFEEKEPEYIKNYKFSAPRGISVVGEDFKGASRTEIEIVGIDINPIITHPELFGEIDEASEITLHLPIVCGRDYRFVQTNSMLKNYADDPSISLTEDKKWVKDKIYHIDEDIFEYSFLVGEGRNTLGIKVYDVEDDILIANFGISAHIHFKEQEEK